MLTRRSLLAAAAGLAGGALVGTPRRARAAWGSWPAAYADLQLAPERRATQVLEVFLYGGLSPWDTFYCRPEWGEDDDRYLYAFGKGALEARLGECGLGESLSQPFAEDSGGELVHLGPWTAPLWGRPDILGRARVLLGQHDQFPHSTAVPLALTGHRLGRPELAGTAAAIARHFAELYGGDGMPRSCVIHPGDIVRLDNVQSALAVGEHPSATRPLELDLEQLPHLLDLLHRPAMGDHRQPHDAVVDAYRRAYTARLQSPAGAALSAPERIAWESVDRARRRAEDLLGWIPPGVFSLGNGEACGETRASTPAMAARVARHLLSQDLGVRYALWIDSGLTPTLDGGHDTHRDHLLQAARNYSHTFETLASVIAAPGENDPAKLDLDTTMIAITSEFGRTPHREDEREGLGHWPGAQVSVLLGGPVDAAAVVGRVDRTSGLAEGSASPAELRMALLMALGVYPFAPGSFVASDVRGATDTRAALLRLRGLLGVSG